MHIEETSLPGVKVYTPTKFEDDRGFFFESFNQKHFDGYAFVQDNHSWSFKGVVRGLHYQLVKPQGKLVRVISGAIFDVAVDIRKSSRTLGNGLLWSFRQIMQNSFGFLQALRTDSWH